MAKKGKGKEKKETIFPTNPSCRDAQVCFPVVITTPSIKRRGILCAKFHRAFVESLRSLVVEGKWHAKGYKFELVYVNT